MERSRRPELAERRARLEGLTLALTAHAPQRVLERGYAMVEDHAGEPVTSADEARRHGEVRIRFADAAVDARVEDR